MHSPRTFDAARDEEVTLAVHVAQVPGVQPAVLIDDLHGLLLLLQVAHEHVPAPDAHLPDAVSVLLVQQVLTPTQDLPAAAKERRGATEARRQSIQHRSARVCGPGLWPGLPTLRLLFSPSLGPGPCRGVCRAEGPVNWDTRQSHRLQVLHGSEEDNVPLA